MAKSSKKKSEEIDNQDTLEVVERPVEATVVHEPTVANGVPFDIWFHIKKFKKHWMGPMREFANSQNVKVASIADWDALFKSY